MKVDVLHYLMLVVIVVLIIVISLKNTSISNLENDLESDLNKYRKIKKEHDYYYKLAEALWDRYRQYEIFPSAFAREIDEISKWY